jgi:hypothetical protein
MMDYTNGWTRRKGRTSIGWPKEERGRRGTSIKLNALKRERERKMRDIIQVKCIKDETKRLIIKDEIKNRWWKKYFDKLFNEDSESSSIELDIYLYDLNRHFVPRIQESKVKDALKKMKGRKLIGSDGILNEVRRSLGDVAIVWLTKLFNLIFRSNKMLDKWRRSILVLIFKNKGVFKVILIIGELN